MIISATTHHCRAHTWPGPRNNPCGWVASDSAPGGGEGDVEGKGPLEKDGSSAGWDIGGDPSAV